MADARSFDVLEVFGRLGIAPRADIYINWRHFVEVDRMSTADVARFFSSLWYPGPDEIDLFDDSFAWVLSISGEGQPVYWRTPRGRGILGGGTTLR
jgi:hypothetical protein